MKFFSEYIKQTFGSRKYLEEKLIQLGRKSYGQVVLLNGGSGSGKSFATAKFIDSDKFKVLDPDEIKKFYVTMKQIKQDPDYLNFDFRNPQHTNALHNKLREKATYSKLVFSILCNSQKDRLPNLLFDKTFTSVTEIDEIVDMLIAFGYKRESINLVWVLTNFELAQKRNMERERVIMPSVISALHENIAKTMFDILEGFRGLSLNGGVYLILNNRENVSYWDASMKVVKDFKYFVLKHPGLPLINPDTFRNTIRNIIVPNLPKTDQIKMILSRNQT